MKHVIFLIILSGSFLINANGQSSVSANKTKVNPTIPEIDKLYEKYKNKTSLSLFTSHGELTGLVEIDYNPDNKPQAIRIRCNSTNNDAVAEFLSQTIDQKKQQGYKRSDGNEEPTTANWIKEAKLEMGDDFNIAFKKGSMYFITNGGHKFGFNSSPTEYWFTIETGDNSRKGGKQASKFEF